MFNLFIMYETYTNGYKDELLNVISLISILCGIFVIVCKNPIESVLFLIGLFLNISIYLILLGINFIGLSYLLVYVGAVSILFLFILMLINVRVSELQSDTSNSIPLAIIICISFSFPVYDIFPYSVLTFNNNTVNSSLNNVWENNISDYLYNIFNVSFNTISNNSEIAFVTSKLWDGNLAETSHITSIGHIMYTSYSLWLIITSIILLLAMVGAIVITIKPKN